MAIESAFNDLNKGITAAGQTIVAIDERFDGGGYDDSTLEELENLMNKFKQIEEQLKEGYKGVKNLQTAEMSEALTAQSKINHAELDKIEKKFKAFAKLFRAFEDKIKVRIEELKSM